MRSQWSSLLAVAGLLRSATAVPWRVTNYEVVVTETIGQSYLYTATERAYPTVTPIPTGLPAVTSVDRYDDDVTDINIILPFSAAQTGFPDLDNPNSPTTDYFVLMTYTGPTTCAGDPWHYTSAIPVSPPYGAAISPTATIQKVTSTYYFQTRTTIDQIILAATDVPSSSLSRLSSIYEPFFSRSCTLPSSVTATGTATGYAYPTSTLRSGGDSGSSSRGRTGCVEFGYGWSWGDEGIGGGYECADGIHWTYGLSFAAFVCAWVFSWLGLFLILGFVQNWFNFRRLCVGKSARRGLPWLWAFMFPILSCLFLIGARKGYASKDPAEQTALKERWRGLGAGTKLKEWFKWGFRHKYPTFLGAEPPRKGSRGYKPGVYQYTQGPAGPAPPYQFQPPPGAQMQQQPQQQWAGAAPMYPGQQPYGPQMGQFGHGAPQQVVNLPTQQPPPMGYYGEGLAPPATEASRSATGPVSPVSASQNGTETMSSVSQSQAGTAVGGGAAGGGDREAQPKNSASVSELEARNNR